MKTNTAPKVTRTVRNTQAVNAAEQLIREANAVTLSAPESQHRYATAQALLSTVQNGSKTLLGKVQQLLTDARQNSLALRGAR